MSLILMLLSWLEDTVFLNYLGDLGMEVLHILAKYLSKFAQDFFVPGVIFQVNLGLDLW